MEPIKIIGDFFDSEDFITNAKWAVFELARKGLDPSDRVNITIDNVYVVSYSFVLCSQKAMISTTLSDGKYYEVTYDNAKHMMYVTTYVRLDQVDIPVELFSTEKSES